MNASFDVLRVLRIGPTREVLALAVGQAENRKARVWLPKSDTSTNRNWGVAQRGSATYCFIDHFGKLRSIENALRQIAILLFRCCSRRPRC